MRNLEPEGIPLAAVRLVAPQSPKGAWYELALTAAGEGGYVVTKSSGCCSGTLDTRSWPFKTWPQPSGALARFSGAKPTRYGGDAGTRRISKVESQVLGEGVDEYRETLFRSAHAMLFDAHAQSVVVPTSSLNADAAPELRSKIKTLVDSGNLRLTLDLANVQTVSPAGLGVIFAAQASMRRDGGRIDLINASAEIYALFSRTGLTRHFSISRC